MMDNLGAAGETVTDLCAAGDVAENSVLRVVVAGHPPLAIYNLSGAFYATEDRCSHGEASLSSGFVIDRDRLAVMGMSAGGYLALAAGYRAHPRQKAVATPSTTMTMLPRSARRSTGLCRFWPLVSVVKFPGTDAEVRHNRGAI